MTTAIVFPGQGSQAQGMQADLAAEYPQVRETYDEASEVLGYDLWKLVQEGPPRGVCGEPKAAPSRRTWPDTVWANTRR